jgi:hypothetical protein
MPGTAFKRGVEDGVFCAKAAAIPPELASKMPKRVESAIAIMTASLNPITLFTDVAELLPMTFASLTDPIVELVVLIE